MSENKKKVRMKGELLDIMDAKEMYERGLFDEINQKVLHPKGLALVYHVESNTILGSLVAPNDDWSWKKSEK